MGNKILNFKMWEDAAANSVSGGGVDMAPDSMGKKELLKRKKQKELSFETEKARIQHDTSPEGDWRKRSKMQQDARSQMWKALGKKLKRK